MRPYEWEIGILVLIAVLVFVWPRVRSWYRIRRRETVEDAIKYIWDCEERGTHTTPEALAGKLKLSQRATLALLRRMSERGLVRMHGGNVCLTPAGKALGLQISRAHRLWERYLSDFTDVPLPEIHRLADRQEHTLSEEEIRDLAARLGHPRRDPHGDPIPTERGERLVEVGVPLTDWPIGQPARIVHIEDEPESIFAQVLAEGLLPGMDIIVEESSPQGVRLKVDGNDIWLASIVASHIHVLPAPKEIEVEEKARYTLADLKPGQRARVVGISRSIRGLLRRRLLDLGFTRGAIVEAVLESAFGHGDPKAFRVRGTTIALRREQAERIYVEPLPPEEGIEREEEAIPAATTPPAQGKEVG